MKKIVLIFMFFCISTTFFLHSSNLKDCSAFANTLSSSQTNIQAIENYYAKVQSTSVFLCSTPSESNAMFEIPYSYFVRVEYGVDDFYKVSFKDISGYVKKSKVTLMNGTPKQPFPNATYKIFVDFNLYESPTRSSNIVTNIGTSSTLTYYGTKVGEQVSSTNSMWYFSSIVTNGTTQFGYVFSGVTDLLTSISVNNENFDVVSSDVLNSTQQTEFHTLSTGTKIILIIAISIPSLLILYFLIKPSKIMQVTKTRKEIKKQAKTKRHGDYFEFDESQL